MIRKIKEFSKKVLPGFIVRLIRLRRNKDYLAFISFAFELNTGISFAKRVEFLSRIGGISEEIESAHTQTEILAYVKSILKLSKTVEGCIVECGCYKGGSTAKFSLAAKLAERKLFVFDSFEGIPKNDEPHGRNIFGGPAAFAKGDYCGKFDEVKSNVEKFGDIGSCNFVKGWFEDTLPSFKQKIAAIYLDVDLVSSTQTCLKYLYPLLSKNGVLYSQDGHLPLVLDLFDDESFWNDEVGCEKPKLEGFGKSKLIKIVKPQTVGDRDGQDLSAIK